MATEVYDDELFTSTFASLRTTSINHLPRLVRESRSHMFDADLLHVNTTRSLTGYREAWTCCESISAKKMAVQRLANFGTYLIFLEEQRIKSSQEYEVDEKPPSFFPQLHFYYSCVEEMTDHLEIIDDYYRLALDEADHKARIVHKIRKIQRRVKEEQEEEGESDDEEQGARKRHCNHYKCMMCIDGVPDGPEMCEVACVSSEECKRKIASEVCTKCTLEVIKHGQGKCPFCRGDLVYRGQLIA